MSAPLHDQIPVDVFHHHAVPRLGGESGFGMPGTVFPFRPWASNPTLQTEYSGLADQFLEFRFLGQQDPFVAEKDDDFFSGPFRAPW